MSFYVSVMQTPESPATSRKALVLGPFNTNGAAQRHRGRVWQYLEDHYRGEAHWWGVGTARHKSGRPPGKLNDQLGYDGPGRLP